MQTRRSQRNQRKERESTGAGCKRNRNTERLNGCEAVAAYANLTKLPEEERAAVRGQLLCYCEPAHGYRETSRIDPKRERLVRFPMNASRG